MRYDTNARSKIIQCLPVETPLADALRKAVADSMTMEIAWYDSHGDDFEVTEAVLASDAVVDKARAALADSDEIRPWTVDVNNGIGPVELLARNLEDAKTQAEPMVAKVAPSPIGTTTWIDVRIECVLTGEIYPETFVIEPLAPDCYPGHQHDWRRPLSIVGGTSAHPGVEFRDGGEIIHDVCCYCARHRFRDNNAIRPDTGEAGFWSVRYEYESSQSIAWSEAGFRSRYRAMSQS